MSFQPSAEQSRIIDAPLVSLRVAAGAGTGKTTTIARRVAALVDGIGLEPEEILGLTFTNKAAQSLADQITELIHGEVERSVPVFTYHGFAAELLREFGILVGVERRAGLITPTFARQIVHDLIRSHRIENLDLTNPQVVGRVLTLASHISNNLVDEVRIPPEPDDVWQARIALLAATELYRDEKLRLGVLDFGDLIAKTHALVTDNPEVGTTIAERYRAVFLDEYQDTDPSQRQLLMAIFAGRVPVMAVGDEDQTIYEWRGASLENFRGFPEHFGTGTDPAPTLPLTENRRSSPEILVLANRIRERIDIRPRDPLTALPGTPSGKVRVARLGTAMEEADWIAEDILSHHDAGTAYSEMALLFRKNKSMLVAHQALNRHGIPFQVANLGGLLDVPEVTDLHAWLQILEHPDHGPAAARILLGSRFRLGIGDLAVITRRIRGDEAEGFGLLEAIDDIDELDLSDAARNRLTRFSDWYRQLLEHTQGVSLVETCRLILDITGAWNDLGSMDPAAGLSARLNLYRFLDLTESWSPLEGRPSLAAFLDYLETMEDEPAEDLDVARLAVADAVTLITVHRAKGLEWPLVYLPALAKGTFPARSGAFDNPLSRPESLPYEMRLDPVSLPDLTTDTQDVLRRAHESQEWRLAYVAVTRAKRELVLTSAYWYGHPEPTKNPVDGSDFFKLSAEVGVVERLLDTAPERPSTDLTRPEPAPDPLFKGGWPEALRLAMASEGGVRSRAADLGISDAYDAKVAEYEQMFLDLPLPPPSSVTARLQTSVTGLVTYASCPKRFYWAEIDRLPRRPNPAARRGVEIHRRIELHNLGIVPLTDPDEDFYDIPESEPGTGSDPYRIFLQSRFTNPPPLLVETPFELRLDEEVWSRGRIDAVYGGDSWEIVDFKSGRKRASDSMLVQLQAYAIAVHDTGTLPSPQTPLAATFAFFGGDKPEEESHVVDEAWLAGARLRLSDLAEGIRSKHWEPTPGEACSNCDFLTVCPAGKAFLES